jgi:hypothetical protein
MGKNHLHHHCARDPRYLLPLCSVVALLDLNSLSGTLGTRLHRGLYRLSYKTICHCKNPFEVFGTRHGIRTRTHCLEGSYARPLNISLALVVKVGVEPTIREGTSF